MTVVFMMAPGANSPLCSFGVDLRVSLLMTEHRVLTSTVSVIGIQQAIWFKTVPFFGHIMQRTWARPSTRSVQRAKRRWDSTTSITKGKLTTVCLSRLL